MSNNLVFKAGKKAFEHIKSNGLKPNDVKVMAGAAGGPKWLILGHIDRVLFTQWFKDRKEPLFLLGSSSGAWRFAAASQFDPVAAIKRFQKAYIHQYYESKPLPETVSLEAWKILDLLMDRDGQAEILNHPFLRLNFMAVRCRGLTAADDKRKLFSGFILAMMANFIDRKSLKIFFERALFYDSRDFPPFGNMNTFPIVKIPLNRQNLQPALLASGSIPLVMSGIDNIPGSFPGVYRDGGVIDYHMDIPFLNKNKGIVLYPHYTDRVVPGWLDKNVFWRRPSPSNMDNVLLVCPSPAFLDKLPYKKIPDRKDFYRFEGRDSDRINYWYKAVDMSKKLGEEFLDAVETGKIREVIQPFF
ncbi:patatin-like phospholipase family protein [Desulfobacterales bacterium HSG17]|nr:patatin-like phospholipase family protein [Desulfobacterales bacterium HSG17]